MEHYAYLQDLAADQNDRQLRVRIWDNKNIIIRRNLGQQQGLATQVWDAWLRQELRRFNGFEPIIEIDDFSGHQEIRFLRKMSWQMPFISSCKVKVLLKLPVERFCSGNVVSIHGTCPL